VRENLMMGAYPRKDREAVTEESGAGFTDIFRAQERRNQPAGQLSGASSRVARSGAR